MRGEGCGLLYLWQHVVIAPLSTCKIKREQDHGSIMENQLNQILLGGTNSSCLWGWQISTMCMPLQLQLLQKTRNRLKHSHITNIGKIPGERDRIYHSCGVWEVLTPCCWVIMSYCNQKFRTLRVLRVGGYVTLVGSWHQTTYTDTYIYVLGFLFRGDVVEESYVLNLLAFGINEYIHLSSSVYLHCCILSYFLHFCTVMHC